MILIELIKNGVKVVRLVGNRDLNEKVVKVKMKLMREYGQLVFVIIVDVFIVIKDGLKVVDFIIGEEIKDGNNYVVLLDVNYCYSVYLRFLEENKKIELEKQYEREFYFMYFLNLFVSIEKILVEINIVIILWKGVDYVKGVKMMVEEDLLILDFVFDLIIMGYFLDVVFKWVIFGSKISKVVFVRVISGNIDEVFRKLNIISRGRIFVEVVRKLFSVEFLKSCIFIDWIIGKYEDMDDSEKSMFINNMNYFLVNV